MKVFVSWSGTKSCQIGKALKEFLESVIQSLEIFISTEMGRGSLWNSLINKELENTSVGIVCLTLDNYEAPWILFESGALAKGIDQNRVCTFLADIDPSILLASPLAQFNHTTATKDSLFELAKTLNKYSTPVIPDHKLEITFDKFWDDFKIKFETILKSGTGHIKSKPPAYKELAGETLEALNRINRQLAIEDSNLGEKIRKIEYRVNKIYDLEFDKHTRSLGKKILIHREVNNSDSVMWVLLYYKDDFEDEIPIIATEILNSLKGSLKDDFARYDCNYIDKDWGNNEIAIKFTFLRNNYIRLCRQ